MLTRVTLQNFKSFGARQDVPLQPLTVLVGANNSGKSNFLSLSRFMANALRPPRDLFADAFDLEGGREAVFHRPAHDDGRMLVGWQTEAGGYRSELRLDPADGQVHQLAEELALTDGQKAWALHGRYLAFDGPMTINPPPSIDNAFNGLHWTRTFVQEQRRLASIGFEKFLAFEAIWWPLESSRIVSLEIEALRADAAADSPLQSNGAGLASELSLGKHASLPEITVTSPAGYPIVRRDHHRQKFNDLLDFIRATVPEIADIDIEPSEDRLRRKLFIVQSDGQRFAAREASDGVLALLAIAAHVFSVGPGGTLFLEEPENHIHPLRIRALVDMLRRAVTERSCQVILSTHSPVLLNEFRDEPDAVLLFKRSPDGTIVRPLADIPELQEDLRAVPPGDLLQAGVFAEVP